MKPNFLFQFLLTASLMSIAACRGTVPNTTLTIVGDQFHINGQPTYAGRNWQGHLIEGLLFNSRMVQGIFDDLNPETAFERSLSLKK